VPAAMWRGPVSGPSMYPQSLRRAASSCNVNRGRTTVAPPARLRISSASPFSPSFPQDRKTPIRGNPPRRRRATSAQKSGSIFLVFHVVPAWITKRGVVPGSSSSRTRDALDSAASEVMIRGYVHRAGTFPPKGALTTRSIFSVTCTSSGCERTFRFVQSRFGDSRTPLLSNPKRSAAPDNRVTTPLFAFPWMSKAMS
jgi:hypothetical protein